MSISTPNAISTPSTSPTITTDALMAGSSDRCNT